MNRFLLLVLFTCIAETVRPQCNDPAFSILSEGEICRTSPVRLINEQIAGDRYYWDLCPEDFSETAVSQSLAIPAFMQGYGYKLLHDNGVWYGFAVSRSLDKLFRFDFNDNPANVPVVVDLGNPGGLMDAPEGIEFFQDGSNWYAFTGKGENTTGQVVKLSFGTDLTNVPSATGYGTFGLGSVRIRDLAIQRQDSNIVLLLLIYNTASINRVNFGSTLENSPGMNNVVGIPGASLPRGFDPLKTCSGTKMHIVCENGLVIQASFGANVLGPITVEGTFNFTSIVQPWKIKTIFHAGNYLSFVSCNNRKYSILDFGDLSLESPPTELPNANDARFVAMEVLKVKGKTVVQGTTGANTLISVTYQSKCGLPKDYSDEKDPASFTYPLAGTFPIDLHVTGNVNELSSASRTLVVHEADAPQLSIAQEGACQGKYVLFSATNAEAISSWSWDLGNGVNDDSPTPEVVYDAAGEYSVQLNAIGANGCFTGDQIEVEIYAPPVAQFDLPVGLLCTNNQFTFSSTIVDAYEGNLTYLWTVDNVEVSNLRDLTYTFTTTGPKQVGLLVSIPGCSSEIITTTPTIQSGPVVDFSFIGTCEDEEFSFQSEIYEIVDFLMWDFSGRETSNGFNPKYVFPEPGEYSVALSAKNSIGCETVTRKMVAVRSKPTVDFVIDGVPNGCSNIPTRFENVSTNPDERAIANWEWKFGDTSQNMLTETHAQHVYQEAGVYNVSLTATTIDGCSNSAEKPVTIQQSPSADFSYPAACEDAPLSFLSTGAEDIAHTYWEIGTSYYYDPSPVHTFKTPGDFPVYLQVIGDNGCIAEKSTTIHVPVPLSPDFSVIKNCVDQEAIFTDITSGVDPVVSRSWNFNPGGLFSGEQAAVAFQQTGNISATLKVTGESGCAYETTRPVVILPAPHANFSASPSTGGYPLEVQFVNTSSDATDYRWSFANETSHEVSPVHTFHEAGEFLVQLTAFNEQRCQHTATNLITTVAPLPDADVELITLSENDDGTYRLIVTIHNKGNTYLRDLPVDIDFGGNLQLREVVEETIAPSSKHNLVLSTDILQPEILEYLCVSMEVYNDINTAGNLRCLRFDDDLYVFSAFPNPASDEVTIKWISQTSKTLTISLLDRMGRLLATDRRSSTVGLNQQIINVADLESGIYFLLVDDGRTRHYERILISNNR